MRDSSIKTFCIKIISAASKERNININFLLRNPSVISTGEDAVSSSSNIYTSFCGRDQRAARVKEVIESRCYKLAVNVCQYFSPPNIISEELFSSELDASSWLKKC